MGFHAPAAYSIGNSLRPLTTPQFNYPGPGTYQPIETQTFKRTLYSKSLNKRHRTKKEKKLTLTKGLGPGSYNIAQKTLWNSPKFSIPKAGNYFETIRSLTPGPQDYKTFNFTTKANKFSFPKSPKLKYPKITHPGPGTYNPRNPLLNLEGKPLKFPASNRSNLEDNKKGPGPGSYNLKFEKLFKGHPAWTFEQSEYGSGGPAKEGPGPGSYNTKHSIGDSPCYLFYNIKKKIPGV